MPALPAVAPKVAGTMPCVVPAAPGLAALEAFNAVVLYMTTAASTTSGSVGYPGAVFAGTRAAIGKDGKPGEAVCLPLPLRFRQHPPPAPSFNKVRLGLAPLTFIVPVPVRRRALIMTMPPPGAAPLAGQSAGRRTRAPVGTAGATSATHDQAGGRWQRNVDATNSFVARPTLPFCQHPRAWSWVAEVAAGSTDGGRVRLPADWPAAALRWRHLSLSGPAALPARAL